MDYVASLKKILKKVDESRMIKDNCTEECVYSPCFTLKSVSSVQILWH